MNEYSFEDIKTGMKERFIVVITEELMNKFRNITGDVNPMHQNDKFAIRCGYREKIVFGMLTSSFLSTLAGVYLPGKYSLIQSVEIKFVRPVYVGDEITVIGEVEEKIDRFDLLRLKVYMVNQNNEKVLKGKMQVGVLPNGK